ncbi:2OG-Fe(II) oxygenase [Serratia quinivorans]|uniref:2OG-Fe(II) oxygenase n=1 Tax=Serratia quinivorans TaxID=137545 RepID=UPI002177F02E|nr:2OG-Fe(II) oxygenase [Serratia quinivorans]CAI0942983.1 Predicted proline hydroxylase [Serratia quinivorans]CAI1740167.1 Predicted proline hydroxylase [Serratia quinivorans]
MNILNLSAFDDASYYKEPWEWGLLHDLISPDGIKSITDEVKNLNFRAVASNSGDKNYRMGLIEMRKQEVKSDALNELIIELTSDNYLTKLEIFTNSQLRDREIELNIWRYSMKDYLSPHVDKDYKFLTQLIYLNESWETYYGGSLNILGSSNEDDIYERILPTCNLSPLIKNCKNAWHSVSPVSSSAPSRYCLQMIYKD